MRSYFSTPIFLVILMIVRKCMTNNDPDDLPIKWHDDNPHPRRIEKEPDDYIEKSLNLADQFAALVGGFDGAMQIGSFIHEELEEVLGQNTEAQHQRAEARIKRFASLASLFDITGKSQPASKESYTIDMGSGDNPKHTAKGMVMDAFGRFVDYLRSNESRSRPSAHHVFDDEL